MSLVGNGTFFFSAPSSTYRIAEHYSIAFLTVIFDNGGWNATNQNLRLQHPGGIAETTDRFWVNLGQSSDLPGIAVAAGNAWGATVDSADELEPVLSEALKRVAAGQAAVIRVILAPVSAQDEDRL